MNQAILRLFVTLTMLAIEACGEGDDPRGTWRDSADVGDGGDDLTDDDDDTSNGDDLLEGTPVRDGGTRVDARAPSNNRDAGRGDDDDEIDAGRGRPSRDAGPATVADAGPVSSGDEVPAGEHCASVAAWPEAASAFEDEVLKLTNEARAVGHNCDTEGMFGPTTPLTMEPQLRCSARLHSTYMATTGEFDHYVPAGSDPGKRIAAAGYAGNNFGENIAWGQATPSDVVDGWLESDGHCSNIMSPSYMHLGVGYVVGKQPSGGSRSAPYWTQNFGAQRSSMRPK